MLDHEHSLDLELLNLPSLDLMHLELPFAREEVEKIVKPIPLDKAPGPNGFTGSLYASCCAIIKGDFLQVLNFSTMGICLDCLPSIRRWFRYFQRWKALWNREIIGRSILCMDYQGFR